MFRSFFLLICLFMAVPAMATPTIAVVDFQKAIEQIPDGKAAKTKIETMYATRKGEIDRMQQTYEREVKDYESRALILSEEARGEAEQQLLQKRAQLEQTLYQYEGELQQTQMTLMQDLLEKMRAMAETVAKEKGYGIVLDSAVIVYMGPDVIDMTPELVKRYTSAP